MRRFIGTLAVLVVLAATATATTASAQVEPSIVVTPNAFSIAGEYTMRVDGSGFTPGIDLFLAACIVPDPDVTAVVVEEHCDVPVPLTADAEGRFVLEVTYNVWRDFAIDVGTADRSESATERVELLTAIDVELVEVPRPGRIIVRINGSGFRPNQTLYAVPCTARGGDVRQIMGRENCNIGDVFSVASDDAGTFSYLDTYDFQDDLAIAVGTFDELEGAAGIVPFPENSCRGLVPTLVGTDGDDDLRGTDGPDIISALDGADTIRGLGGDDIVCAGPGDDRVFAGSGNDLVFGDMGIDKVRGGAGMDRLVGGAQMDFLLGGAESDELDGGKGTDRLRGGTGDDVVLGRGGEDVLWGGPGNDQLVGGSKQDILKGGAGDDACTETGPDRATRVRECES